MAIRVAENRSVASTPECNTSAERSQEETL